MSETIRLTRPFEHDPAWYEERAEGLLRVRGSGPPQARGATRAAEHLRKIAS